MRNDLHKQSQNISIHNDLTEVKGSSGRRPNKHGGEYSIQGR